MTLQGTTALVIGASSGIGKATAHALTRGGATVVAVARDPARLRALRQELGDTVQIVAADATDVARTAALLREHRPTSVVLAAGVRPEMAAFDALSWDQFSAAWQTDVRATYELLRAAFALPLPRGSTIAIVSSGAARNGSFLSGGYAGAKRMQWMLAGYADRAAADRDLDLRTVAVVPTQLVEDTAIAELASTTYGAVLGMSGRAYLDRFDVPLRAEALADAILAVLRREIAPTAHAIAVSGNGIVPLE